MSKRQGIAGTGYGKGDRREQGMNMQGKALVFYRSTMMSMASPVVRKSRRILFYVDGVCIN